ncbi:MAG: hypothetical protein M1335_07375 [Chloroflexi bacterium]|nr:hypothetical protein [Chloroflexota bacterium]
MTDHQPDQATTNPKKGSGLIQGAFDPGNLILKLELDRIDWLLVPTEQAVEELLAVPEFAALGPASDVISTFFGIVEKWLSRVDLPAIGRMAFGLVLIHPEADRASGYRRLPDYVPVRVDPESSDFLYQINLPRLQSATGIDGLGINRLSRWRVAMQRVFGITMSGRPIQPPGTHEAFALTLELDINTVPAFPGPIPRDRLLEVFRELVASAQQIAADGVLTP